MELLPKPVDINVVWPRLREAVETLLLGGMIDKKTLKDRYTDVYYVTIAQPPSLSLTLYRELKSYVENYCTAVGMEVYSKGDENIMSQYYRYWIPYSHSVPQINRMFQRQKRQLKYDARHLVELKETQRRHDRLQNSESGMWY